MIGLYPEPEPKKPRIWIGFHEICNYVHNLSMGIRQLGYPVTVTLLNKTNTEGAVNVTSPLRPTNYKVIYYKSWLQQQVRLIIEFIRNFYKHDIFIFNTPDSFFSTGIDGMYYSPLMRIWGKHLDWAILKAFGKKIVVICHGCDIRHSWKTKWFMNLMGEDYYLCKDCKDNGTEKCSHLIKSKRIQNIEKYADHIFAYLNNGYMLNRKYHTIIYPLDLDILKYRPNDRSIPVFIRASNRPDKKGTKYFDDALKKLRKEGVKFKYIKLEKTIPHREYIELLKTTDIVFDQMGMTGFGTTALEGMATGNVVFSGSKHETPHIPTIDIIADNPDQTDIRIWLQVTDKKRRLQICDSGREYVEKNHGYLKVAKEFLEAINVLSRNDE